MIIATSLQLKVIRAKTVYFVQMLLLLFQSTKNDPLYVYPQLDPNTVHVVRHGANHVPLLPREVRSDFQFSCKFQKFLLYVGRREHYKGFDHLLNSFTMLCDQNTSLGLVCVGSEFTQDEVSLLKRLNIYDKVVSMHADNDLLISLYRSAVAFIYPSFKEGFGLPILEAMRLSCPVICSDIPSSVEIAQDKALIYTCGDNHALVDSVSKVLCMSDSELCALLSEAQSHASGFTWEDAAFQTALFFATI